jgi:glycosyltransferase involved in cell wall biosynthesis
MKPVSMCVHTFDEAAALRRLVLSSLPLAHLWDEWVVVDHRSGDDTAAVCDELSALVPLRYLHEPRDLSAAFTFADVRNATVQACKNDVVVLHDADFILGPAFGAMVEKAAADLRSRHSQHFGAGYNVPVIWDHLRTDADGVIVDHGRIWVHSRPPRVLLKAAVEYLQDGNDGRWERANPTDPGRQKRLHLTRRRPALARDALVSVNIKPADRLALRETMTMFMEDAMTGAASGEWLANFEAGTVRQMPPYDFSAVDLRGWRLNAPDLDLSA